VSIFRRLPVNWRAGGDAFPDGGCGEPRLPGSSNWQLLDPAARAYALAGDREKQRAILGRLEEMEYRPVEPWPWPAPL
jgi:hypothetical protein